MPSLFGFSGVSADDASRKAREKPQTVLLKEDLLCAYDKNVRPVIYHGNATFVFVSMLLRTLTFVSNGVAEVFMLWDHILIIIPFYTDLN